MNHISMSIDNIFEQLSRDLVTCTECLQILHPLLNVRGAEVLNGTCLANVTIRVRDSIIHEAILSLTRVLDKKTANRICIERLIHALDLGQEKLGKAQTKLKNIRESQEWLDLKSVRNGRIAHNLAERGGGLSWQQIKTTRDHLIELVDLLFPSKEFSKTNEDVTKFWNKAARQFWQPIFLEARSKS